MRVKRIEQTLLIILDAFLALTAAAGGVGLLTGIISPGLDLLQGSPFSSYTIPGLALLVLVGGSAILATGLMFRFPQLGVLASAAAGVMIMGFEIVEVLIIGSDPGVARNLQLFYFTLGLLIALLASGMWVSEHGLSVSGARNNPVH